MGEMKEAMEIERSNEKAMEIERSNPRNEGNIIGKVLFGGGLVIAGIAAISMFSKKQKKNQENAFIDLEEELDSEEFGEDASDPRSEEEFHKVSEKKD